jgi:hypothetical protein
MRILSSKFLLSKKSIISLNMGRLKEIFCQKAVYFLIFELLTMDLAMYLKSLARDEYLSPELLQVILFLLWIIFSSLPPPPLLSHSLINCSLA